MSESGPSRHILDNANTEFARSETVLIVSDEDDNTSSLWSRVQRVNEKIVRSTIEDFRGLLEGGDIALVLVDSPYATAQTLDMCAEIRRMSHQPLLVLTSTIGEDLQLQAYEVGVNECILRPIGSGLLEAKVGAWLRWSLGTSRIHHDLRRTRSRIACVDSSPGLCKVT